MGARANAVYICGGDMRPDDRGECPDALHDWPLPAGYVDSAEVAARRLRNGWRNVRCARCGLYGWREGRKRGEGDTFVPASPPTTRRRRNEREAAAGRLCADA